MDFAGSILNNIEEALVTIDGMGRILYFNKVAESICNETLENPLREGQEMINVVSRERKDIVKAILHEVKQTRQLSKSFAEYKKQNGETIYLEFKYVPVVDEKGEVTHIHTFFRDITPEKVFERRLSNELANIRNLVDKANAIIIGIDMRGYITDWNKHCAEKTGFEKNEVYARRLSDVLLEPASRLAFDELIVNVLSKEAVTNYELNVVTRYGKKLTFLINTSIRTSQAEEIIGIVLVGQDVTELMKYRKSLEQQVEERTVALQQALAKEKEVVDMKSRFVSVASHEFRTPLSSIEFAANFIKQNSRRLAPGEMDVKLSSIEQQIKHMKHLLDDVLHYSKSEAGKIHLLVSTFDLQRFIRDLNETIQNTTGNTHVIECLLENLPMRITTDEKLLRNILSNLLTNAIKFSPEARCVKLTAKGEAGSLKFEVTDEGLGIPEEEREKIFDPFVRAENVQKIQGTGLGLSIVRKAVELLNGTVHVTSQAGKGSTFNVIIPL
jgi:PAS domain S-box-containing protein